MTYSTIDQFVSLEVLSTDDMNNIVDNLDALKNPPTDVDDRNSTITLSDNVNFNGIGVSASLTTTGGDVLCFFVTGINGTSSGSRMYGDFEVDGTTRIGGLQGIADSSVTGATEATYTMVGIFRGLAAGLHTFEPVFRTNGMKIANNSYAHFFAKEL